MLTESSGGSFEIPKEESLGAISLATAHARVAATALPSRESTPEACVRRQRVVGMHDETFPAVVFATKRGTHPDNEFDTKFLCLKIRIAVKTENFCSEVETLNRGKPHLFVRDWVKHSFKPLISRTIREQRSEERRLAERRTRKHR